uniref:Uncharacterized protein n=1 Tax=Plectus sambesii TaxID=2011161 RepID=A0A914W2E1_9BILA
MIAWTAFHIWQLVVIFKCKRYLLEKNPVNLMPTIMYGNGNAIGTQQVIQMQLPTQAWQQPGVQWTIQQTQYQQPIVQQQFQEPFHPFEPPPERTIWGESQEGSQGNEMQEKY